MDMGNNRAESEPQSQREDYSWDGSGQPDPEVQRLEALLGKFRHERPALPFPAIVRDRPWSFFPRRIRLFPALATAAAAVAAIAVVTFLEYGRKAASDTGILVDQGLYPDEAHAMVETWRDSGFEEGSRLIYIVPRSFIDRVLPLTINPTPGQIVRVFVGRLEIVTPATASAVETAVASGDQATLNKYSRFLEPILQTVREQQPELTRERRP
jgi:hypothetical protein